MSKPWLSMICSTCNGRGYCIGIGERHADCTDCHGSGVWRVLPSELKRFEEYFQGGYLLYVMWLDPQEKRKGHRRARNSSLIRVRCEGHTTLFPHAEMLHLGFTDEEIQQLSSGVTPLDEWVDQMAQG